MIRCNALLVGRERIESIDHVLAVLQVLEEPGAFERLFGLGPLSDCRLPTANGEHSVPERAAPEISHHILSNLERSCFEVPSGLEHPVLLHP